MGSTEGAATWLVSEGRRDRDGAGFLGLAFFAFEWLSAGALPGFLAAFFFLAVTDLPAALALPGFLAAFFFFFLAVVSLPAAGALDGFLTSVGGVSPAWATVRA